MFSGCDAQLPPLQGSRAGAASSTMTGCFQVADAVTRSQLRILCIGVDPPQASEQTLQPRGELRYDDGDTLRRMRRRKSRHRRRHGLYRAKMGIKSLWWHNNPSTVYSYYL